MQNKHPPPIIILLFCLILTSIGLSAITSGETPLFDPINYGKHLGLARASSSETNFNNINHNPASIINSKGISLHATTFQDIDYSGITFANEHNSISFGLSYIGSSIHSISRSVIDSNLDIIEVDATIPYEYHSLNYCIGKDLGGVKLGIGLNHKIMQIDDETIQNIYTSSGILFTPLENIGVGASIIHSPASIQKTNALLLEHQIILVSIHFKLSDRTTLYLGTIENKNEVNYRSTFHYSFEHYFNEFAPVRIGLDHNRITFGTGVHLTPFEIDVGWGQSLDDIMEDQIIVSFSYSFESKNKRY